MNNSVAEHVNVNNKSIKINIPTLMFLFNTGRKAIWRIEIKQWSAGTVAKSEYCS